MANVQNGFLNLERIKTIAVPEKEAASSSLAIGDVVVTEGGDIDKLGRGAIWNGEIQDCLHQNHIFSIRSTESRLLPDFLVRKMESHHGRSYFYMTAKRTTNLAATNQATLGLLPLFLPEIEEQIQITRFLNWKVAQIKKFIRNKRRLIKLLKEQKQNVINQAMTRGLDPNVKLKSSGVEWIGDIPEHWQVRRLKFLCRNLNEQTFEKKPGDIYIALEHVESWTGRISLSGDESIFDSQVKRFQPDDVLFGKLRPYLAKVAKPKIAGIFVGEFLVLRATENISPEFLEQKLRSKCIIDLINSSTFGAKMPRADWKFIGSMKFSYPSANEQGEILEHIQKKSAKIDQAITRAQREIELIQEYRIRLISDVVTGQVNVRGIEAPELAREALLLLNEGVGDRCSIL